MNRTRSRAHPVMFWPMSKMVCPAGERTIEIGVISLMRLTGSVSDVTSSAVEDSALSSAHYRRPATSTSVR